MCMSISRTNNQLNKLYSFQFAYMILAIDKIGEFGLRNTVTVNAC